MTNPGPFLVLLVCSGNTCRSSMAEALLRDALGRLWPAGLARVEVGSAGTMAYSGAPASERAVAALRERGLDLSGHRARQATLDIVRQSGLILTMTRGHKAQLERFLAESGGQYGAPDAGARDAGARDVGAPGISAGVLNAPRIFTLREYAFPHEPSAQTDIQDPFGASLETYRATAAELAEVLERVVQRLRQELEQSEGSAPR